METDFNFLLARRKRGITQTELASQLNTTKQLICMIENGRVLPTRNMACEIARILKTTPEELFPEMFSSIEK